MSSLTEVAAGTFVGWGRGNRKDTGVVVVGQNEPLCFYGIIYHRIPTRDLVEGSLLFGKFEVV